MVRWNPALHPRDVLGRFAVVNGYARNSTIGSAWARRATGNGNGIPIRTTNPRTGIGKRFATKRDAFIQANVSRVLDATKLDLSDRYLRGKTVKGRKATYNRAGLARQGVINRYNTAKYSPTGRRARAGARSAAASAGRIRQRASSSRASRYISRTRDTRVSKAIARTNARHGQFPSSSFLVNGSNYRRAARIAARQARRPRYGAKGSSPLNVLIRRR